MPIRQADEAIKLAEEVRKSKPDAKLVSECMSADYNLAMKRLGEHFADDEKVKALTARYEAACPLMKK